MTAALPLPAASASDDAAPAGVALDGYRAHLDGLRALAVYLVVLFHARSAEFRGGFIGVDVFFVLSGYLVTQLLWRDLARGGRIRLARFYARRSRRLLPAAFVTLAATALVYPAIAAPGDVEAARAAFQAAFLYAANWLFVARATEYFGGDIEQNPVLHFWSLAVEEQFYLLWPLILGALVAAARRWNVPAIALVRATVMTGIVGSLVWALALQAGHPAHAYYGTDARAYQLLLGALLATAPGVTARLQRAARTARFVAPLSLLLLVALATPAIDLTPIVRGAAVAVVTALAIAATEADQGGPTQRLLSRAPVVYLGRISYGTYLWHWPVVLVLTSAVELGTPWRIALTVLLASALASLSFQLLEQPVRRSTRLDIRPRAVVASGLAGSGLAALVLMPTLLAPRAGSAPVTGRGAGTAIPADLDFAGATFLKLPNPPDCRDTAPSGCTIVQGTGRHLLLIGDSHAQMLIPTFTEIAQRENLTLSVAAHGGCPWQRHLYSRIKQPECRARKEDAYERVIPALQPDIVVAINYGWDNPHVPALGLAGEDGVMVRRGTPAFDELLRAVTQDSIAQLESMAGEVLIIEPIPVAPKGESPAACLVRGAFLEDCRYVVPLAPSSLEQLYRQIDADRGRIRAADFDRLVCPWLPVCDPVIGGHIVKLDTHHLTPAYARAIADQVDDYLKGAGLLPRNATADEHATAPP